MLGLVFNVLSKAASFQAESRMLIMNTYELCIGLLGSQRDRGEERTRERERGTETEFDRDRDSEREG